MNPVYMVANYFIEAINKSPNFIISFDNIPELIKRAPPAEKEYLEKCLNGNFFTIFNKFPDIFIVEACYVKLTNAFLSLYALKKSKTSFSAIKKYHENSAISFFRILINQNGPQHYIHLFKSLLFNSNTTLSCYFQYFSIPDVYNFFLTNSHAFIINNGFVSMRPDYQGEEYFLSSENYIAVVQELKESVQFLLTCFDSLHYIEVKQCISYVSNSVSEFLDKYSLIKQREIFENIPEIQMNNTGFLSLKNLNMTLSLSDDKKLLLLFVCILSFKTKVHFEKLIKNIARDRSNVVDKLCDSSVAEQILFFERRSDYFLVSKDGVVRLKPSFICPICTFDAPQNLNLPEKLEKSQKSKSVTESSNNADGSGVMDKNPKVSAEILSKENSEEPVCSAANGILSSITPNSLNENAGKSESLTEKSKSGLESNHKSTVHCNVLDKLQEIPDKVMLKQKLGTSFQNNIGPPLSASQELQKAESESRTKVSNSLALLNFKKDNSDIVNECSTSSESKSNTLFQKEGKQIETQGDALHKKVYSDLFKATGISEDMRQRTVVCVLFLYNNFPKIDPIKALKSILVSLNDVRKHFNSLSEEYKKDFVDAFFVMVKPEILKKMEGKYVFDGVISKEKVMLFISYMLADIDKEIHFQKIVKDINSKNIAYIQSDVSGQFKFFKNLPGFVNIYDDGYVSLSEKFDYIDLLIMAYTNLSKNHKSENESSLEERKKSKIPEKVSKTIKMSPVKTEEKSMFKTLKYVYHLIKETFGPAFFDQVVETFVIALKDVYEHFSCLPYEKKYKFIEDCYFSVDPHSKESSLRNLFAVESKIKEIILISYIIVTKKKLHFSEIVLLLKVYEVNASVCVKKPSDQFKYFKNFSSYLEINGDGFVFLKPSFKEIGKIITSVNAFMPVKLEKCQEKLSSVSDITFCSPPVLKNSHFGQSVTVIGENGKSCRKEITINNQLVQTTSKSPRRSRSRTRAMSGSSSIGSDYQIEYNAEDIIIDFAIFILSITEEIAIKKLVTRLSWCKLENVKTFFSSTTTFGKENFFRDFPQYFNVSQDGILSLKENFCKIYRPKTKLNISELFDYSLSNKTDNNKIAEPAPSYSFKVNSSKYSKSAEVPECSTSLLCSDLCQTDEIEKVTKQVSSSFRPSQISIPSDLAQTSDKTAKLLSTTTGKDIAGYFVNQNQVANKSLEYRDTKIIDKISSSSKNQILKIKNATIVNSFDDFSVTKKESYAINEIVETSGKLKTVGKELSSEMSTQSTEQNFKSHDEPINDPHNDYISELIDSMLSNSKNETLLGHKSSSPGCLETLALDPSVHECSGIEKNNLITSTADVVSFSEQISTEDTFQSISVSERSTKSSSEEDSYYLSDKRAVNFFCVMLHNYNNFECGIPVEFMEMDLCTASKEVQNYIRNHFKGDLLLFFLKHQEVFSVSPESHNVSLIKE